MIAGFLVGGRVRPAPFGAAAGSNLAAQVRRRRVRRRTQPVGPTDPARSSSSAPTSTRCALRSSRELSGQDTNRQLDEQAQELERSNSDLEQFAYVASHDLQEPLRKVASFCQLLQRRYAGKLDERADQYIGFAVDGAERMQQLINDLLSFSRVGRTTAAFTEVALDDVARRAIAQLEPARADVDGPIELGAAAGGARRRVAAAALFVNLIGNGLKFHREGVPPASWWRRERIGGRVAGHGLRQRHRYRSGVHRQGFRDLPTAARAATSMLAPESAWRWRRRSWSSTAGASASTRHARSPGTTRPAHAACPSPETRTP